VSLNTGTGNLNYVYGVQEDATTVTLKGIVSQVIFLVWKGEKVLTRLARVILRVGEVIIPSECRASVWRL
jgi:hypothetical protein